MVTCEGIINAESNALNIIPFPLNRYFANAYPAIELKTNETPVTRTESNRLLKKFVANRKRVNSISYCTKVNGFGISVGGYVEAFPSAINDAASIQKNGISVRILNTASAVYSPIIFRFFTLPPYAFGSQAELMFRQKSL